MKIYVIRHGETDANKQGVFQGWTDFPLNEFGIELAQETAIGLKDIPFDICFSSPLSRAKQTAEIVLKGKCPIVYDDRLKEISAGDFEMLKFKDTTDSELIKKYHSFFTNPFECYSFPNGENVNNVIKRTQEFLFELGKKNYETVLVSTHGCALRCMLNCLYDNPKDFWQGGVPLNCAVSIIEANNGIMKLIEKDKIFYDKEKMIDRYK